MTSTKELPPIFQGFVGEINECFEGIRQINNRLRHVLHEFEGNGGYLAIGYKTFRGFSNAYLSPYMFRRVKEENSARMIEMIISVPIGTYSYKALAPLLNRERVIVLATKEAHDNASEVGLACNLERAGEIRSLWQKITAEAGTDTPTPAQIKSIANRVGIRKPDPVKSDLPKDEYRELLEKYNVLQAENHGLKRQIERLKPASLTENIIARQRQEIERLKDEKARLERKNQELVNSLPFDRQLAASVYQGE
jgi:hypothetical protein